MRKSKSTKLKAVNPELLKTINALHASGRYKESILYCEKLVKQVKPDAESLRLYGTALGMTGESEKAIEKFDMAIAMEPKNLAVLGLLGAILMEVGNIDRATSVFCEYISIDKNSFTAWMYYGNCLRQLERITDAAQAFLCAKNIDEKRHEPYQRLAEILKYLRRYKDAELFMDKAIELMGLVDPSVWVQRIAFAVLSENFDYIKNNYHRIKIMQLSDRDRVTLELSWMEYLSINNLNDEAIDIGKQWIGTEFESQFMSRVGLFYGRAGRLNESLSILNKIVENEPNRVETRWNLALLQLQMGDLIEGLKNYEIRWDWREFPSARRKFDAPRWEGESVAGKRLLIWGEQGIGDEIRFSSLVPDLKSYQMEVYIECAPKLVSVFQLSFPWACVAPNGPDDCRGDKNYIDFDFQIPIGSLAIILRKDLQSFYSRQKPWIPRLKSNEENVRSRLKVKAGEMLVGLCWRSINQTETRNKVYFDVEEFAPLQSLRTAVFVSVQYDYCLDELNKVRAMGLPVFHYVNIDQKDNLLDAASLLGACDIVIAPSVSVIDLAAGMGVPVIYIGPEISEVKFGTNEVPWYPRHVKYYNFEPNQASVAIRKIIQDWPMLLDWANSVTTSGRGTNA